MNAAEFYRRGISYLEKAVTADENKDYTEAKEFYERACAEFLLGVKRDNNLERRNRHIGRLKEYLSRAETVKALSQKNGSRKRFKVSNEVDESERGFNKVAGMEHVKQSMREAVILPMTQPQLFTGKRVPWKGVLLFGPPGTGKSFMAQALSEEADVNFVGISSSDIVSKYQGESERAVKALFEDARKSKKPTVIFIDEVDSIGGSRDKKSGTGGNASVRLLTELLKQMDGLGSENAGITVIGATNHAEEIDPALRRRFEKRLYVPLPGMKSRMQILESNIGTDPDLHSLSKKDFVKLAKITKGYSCSDLTNVVNEALMIPVRHCQKASYFKEVATKQSMWEKVTQGPKTQLVPCPSNDPQGKKMKMFDPDFPADRLLVPKVTFTHVANAIKKLKPSVSEAEIKRHEEFAQKFCGNDNLTEQIRQDEAQEEREIMKELKAAQSQRLNSIFSNRFLMFTRHSEEDDTRTAVLE